MPYVTPRGITAPGSGDAVDALAQFKTLADTTDAAISAVAAQEADNRVQSGRAQWSAGNSWPAGNIKQVTIPFTRPFALPPSVSATVSSFGGGTMNVTARAVASATQITIYAYNPFSTTASADTPLTIDWIAVGKLA